MIESYRKVRKAQETAVEVEMAEYLLVIEGRELAFLAMSRDEILLQGKLDCLRVAPL